MNFRMIVTSWRMVLEQEAISPYPGFDGRTLSLGGTGRIEGHECAPCSLSLRPVIRAHDTCAEASGHAEWYKIVDSLYISGMLEIPADHWEELWRRSAMPPHTTVVEFHVEDAGPEEGKSVVRYPRIIFLTELPSPLETGSPPDTAEATLK